MARIEVSVAPGIDDVDEGFAHRVVVSVVSMLDMAEAEVSVLFSGDARIQELNKKYMDIDSATDVMAFPSGDEGDFLGDIIISVDTARRQAKELGHSLRYELTLLLVHGILHLTGFTDYEESSRQEMFHKTDEILHKLNLSQNPGR
ncbi:rRNA maturation RNase YbeY [bacterium]|nr:rRNA maturation RNase YbeY [bacterium]